MPWCTTEQEDKYICVQFEKQTPHKSSTGMKECPQNTSLNVDSEEETPGCCPSRQSCKEKATWLANKNKILTWAKEHRHCTEKDWKKVLWTDKSKFEVLG